MSAKDRILENPPPEKVTLAEARKIRKELRKKIEGEEDEVRRNILPKKGP